jgi:glycine/D-amino acid oxidase-like deaminating enzyme
LEEARSYLARRFPALRSATVVAGEVCQYENTSNGDFLIDRHPDFENVWLLGGGSGHGFKHAPAVGEALAKRMLEDAAVDERFLLSAKEDVHHRGIF